MTEEVTVTVRPEDEKNTDLIGRLAARELAGKNIRVSADRLGFRLLKKSIDARHGTVKFHLRLRVFTAGEPDAEPPLPVWKQADGRRSVIIVGSGPAGLFGALRLLEHGIRPVILERGQTAAVRRRDIAGISVRGEVNGDSNYCFGEGGAGAFSDGKLYTRSNKRGDIGRILRIFALFGADQSVLTDSRPHIGTDRLPAVVGAMREKITALGGSFRFGTRVSGLIRDGNGRVTGVTAEDVLTGETAEFSGGAVLLATGHSASDVYRLFAKEAPSALEAKAFAVGVRVEHPREVIDTIQYHGRARGAVLPAAEYRLSAQADGRGVYSFCMCPGGFVVPSASGPDEIVVNGMSAAGRNSKWSNAAVVVETRPEDIPAEFRERAEKDGCPALAPLYFRAFLERETKRHGRGQAAPAQRAVDFLEGRESDTLPPTSYTPGVVPSRLDLWLPGQLAGRLSEGLRQFGKSMRGYLCRDALLIAGETRTSSPVRILRDSASFECPALPGLYPAGEGAGHSGGIVSSAMDGENACEAIARALLSE